MGTMAGTRAFRLTLLLMLVAWSAGCLPGRVTMVPAWAAAVDLDSASLADHDAVYIYDVGWVYYHVRGLLRGPSLVYQHEAKIRLLTRAATEASRYGNIAIDHLGDLLAVSAQVEKADGSIRTLRPADMVTTAIQKDVVPGAIPAIHLNRTVLVFPDLQPGDTIAYRSVRFGAEWSWEFNRADAPVLFSRFAMEKHWKKLALQALLIDRHKLSPLAEERTLTAGAFTSPHQIWTAKNVPAIRTEPQMPSVSSLSSRMDAWFQLPDMDLTRICRSYWAWIAQSGELPVALLEEARRATTGMTTARDKARALRALLAENLQIVDQGEITPVSPARSTPPIDFAAVWTRRRATVEQATALLVRMLKAVGQKAKLVLTASAGSPEVNPQLHSIHQFRQVLLALDDGTQVDLNDVSLPFGLIAEPLQGRAAVVIDQDGFALALLPDAPAEDNRREFIVEASLTPRGDLSAQIEVLLSGHRIPADLRRGGDARAWAQALATSIHPKAQIGQTKVEAAAQDAAARRIRFELKIEAYAGGAGDRLTVGLAPLLSLARWAGPAPSDRQNDVLLPTRGITQVDLRLQLPEGSDPEGRTDAESDRAAFGNGAMRFLLKTDTQKPGEVKIVRRWQTSARRIDPDTWRKSQTLLRRYIESGQRTLILKPAVKPGPG